ncbi:uncharacterized protein LOC126822067 [Patella vulgata]|uniref:uncharacterized protein LOC126822067 n=1 Tax=Patella vulgata TaxID=6465 RepID=UPI00217F4D91|nr:uncharacterized protein LOC126822067 [Patella vulgata]
MAASVLAGTRSKGDDMLETAEDLLESFEQASDLLSEIEENYINDSEGGEDDKKKQTFQQFREGLDTARTLFSTLKREKWRLSKREMSVELRMGELEDYKSHLKKDMSSLNETVDILSVRIIQLENSLAECQDTIERLEADVNYYKEQLTNSQKHAKNVAKSNEKLNSELQNLKATQSIELLGKKLKSLEMANSILQEENGNLKTIIRTQESNMAN